MISLPPNKFTMKKLLAIVAIAAFMASCNGEKKAESTEAATGDSVTMDANQMSNMADSANKMMDKMGDSANKMMDSASKMVSNMADTAKKMTEKAAEKMEPKH